MAIKMHSVTRIPSVIATASFFLGAFSHPHGDKNTTSTSFSQTKFTRGSTSCSQIQYSFPSGENGPGTANYNRSEAVKVSCPTAPANMTIIIERHIFSNTTSTHGISMPKMHSVMTRSTLFLTLGDRVPADGV
jgi:hypothetical protein